MVFPLENSSIYFFSTTMVFGTRRTNYEEDNEVPREINQPQSEGTFVPPQPHGERTSRERPPVRSIHVHEVFQENDTLRARSAESLYHNRELQEQAQRHGDQPHVPINPSPPRRRRGRPRREDVPLNNPTRRGDHQPLPNIEAHARHAQKTHVPLHGDGYETHGTQTVPPNYENNNMGGEERRAHPSPIRALVSPIKYPDPSIGTTSQEPRQSTSRGNAPHAQPPRRHRGHATACEDCARYDSDEEPEPYSPRILALPYLQGFKMPTTTKYDGSTDPGVHISDFNTLMRAHQVVDDLRCVLFLVTLTGVAKTWFKKFKRHSITSWDQLSRDFKKELCAAKARNLEFSSLANLKQQPGKSLRAYINRFNAEAAKARDVDDSGRLMALGAGITNGSQFWDSL
uniref:Retrotransposon gag domain-containing protein n=1 Tax=Cannabis sativa TaxID=3483 RepID=A0A803Q729_CANSA